MHINYVVPGPKLTLGVNQNIRFKVAELVVEVVQPFQDLAHVRSHPRVEPSGFNELSGECLEGSHLGQEALALGWTQRRPASPSTYTGICMSKTRDQSKSISSS